VMTIRAQATPLVNCHPERSEGPAVRRKMQILRFAQNDSYGELRT
jgi:hypothetical protein